MSLSQLIVRRVRELSATSQYSFCAQAGCADGTNPNGGVILASNGNLYGTTVSGGTKGSGTIFKMTTVAKVRSTTQQTDNFVPGNEVAVFVNELTVPIKGTTTVWNKRS